MLRYPQIARMLRAAAALGNPARQASQPRRSAAGSAVAVQPSRGWGLFNGTRRREGRAKGWATVFATLMITTYSERCFGQIAVSAGQNLPAGLFRICANDVLAKSILEKSVTTQVDVAKSALPEGCGVFNTKLGNLMIKSGTPNFVGKAKIYLVDRTSSKECSASMEGVIRSFPCSAYVTNLRYFSGEFKDSKGTIYEIVVEVPDRNIQSELRAYFASLDEKPPQSRRGAPAHR